MIHILSYFLKSSRCDILTVLHSGNFIFSKSLFDGLQVRYPVPERYSVKLLGFVKDMDRLTALADVFVGKPGGLSVAENAALGVGISKIRLI